MSDEKDVQVPEEDQAQDDSSQNAEISPDEGQQAAEEAVGDQAGAEAEESAELPDISEGVDPIPEVNGDEIAAEDMPPPEESAEENPSAESGEENPPAEEISPEAEASAEDNAAVSEEVQEEAQAEGQEENPDFSDDEMSAMTDEEKAMLMTMDDVPEDTGESIGSNGLLSQEDLDAAMEQASEQDMSGTGGLLDSADIPQENEGKNLDLERPKAPEPDTPVSKADFQQLSPASAGGEKPRNIDLLMDVDLPISIELGRTRMNISDILALGPGSVVELEKLVGEPVDLLVNQKTVARGEVVVVEENFGLRITELVSAEERIKNL